MVGKIFITRSGYDPELGKHVKDPYLGSTPSLGACRPDLRRSLKEGDHIFTISGRVPAANQYVMGGFEIAEKMDAIDAFQRFPDQHLRRLSDGQLAGNIIVDQSGVQHPFDDHSGFERRIKNYVVGRNGISLTEASEIAKGRRETLEALQEILKRSGTTPFQVVGRFGSTLSEPQIEQFRKWLISIKRSSN